MGTLPNAKHERFAQGMAKGLTIEASYTAAGYKSKGASARACGSALLSKPNIMDRVDELKAAVVERVVEQTGLTRSYVLDGLRQNFERAMQAEAITDAEGRPTGEYRYEGNVANRSLELIGKELGMFVERKEVGKPGDFERMNDDELAREVEKTARELGVPIPGTKSSGIGGTKH